VADFIDERVSSLVVNISCKISHYYTIRGGGGFHS